MHNAKKSTLMIDKEFFRIKEGSLSDDKIKIPVDFGIISIIEGIFYCDFYINESYDLDAFMVGDKTLWEREFNVTAITVDYEDLEIDRLLFRKITPHKYQVRMQCLGKLLRRKKENFPDLDNNEEACIHYIEFEGLELDFTDLTYLNKIRNDNKVNDFKDWERDHTKLELVYKKIPIEHTIYKDPDSDKLVAQFYNKDYFKLTYKDYLKIKRQYVRLLSFVNGAEVQVRKECTGRSYTIGKIDSQEVIYYSFTTINNLRFNKYLPLKDPFFLNHGILHKIFKNNFIKFCQWDEKLGLTTIIFLLNNAQQSQSIEGKFFIQIIAFERLTTLYSEHLNEKDEHYPNSENFREVKEQFFKVLDNNKEAFGPYYNLAKSKLGNLNLVQKLSTTAKMYRILEDYNIEVTDEIRKIIEVVRHKTVHRGDIGENFGDMLLNFNLLDELIREIILRMIDYKGVRNNKVLYLT